MKFYDVMIVGVYFVASGCHPCLCSAVQVKLIGRIRSGCNLGKYNNQPSDKIILIQQSKKIKLEMASNKKFSVSYITSVILSHK